MSEEFELRPFREVLSEYAPHLDLDPYWTNPKGGGNLMLQAVVYMVTKKKVLPGDRELAKKALDILLESGVDPTVSTSNSPSPLEVLEYIDEKNLYDYIVNKTLEAPPAFEAVAFENKFTDMLKNLGGKIKRTAQRASGFPPEEDMVNWVNKASEVATKKIAEQRREKLRSQGFNEEEVEAEIAKQDKNSEDQINREKIIMNLLPTGIDSSIKGKLASKIVKETRNIKPQGYRKDITKALEEEAKKTSLFKVIVKFETRLDLSKCTPHFTFLLDPQFGKNLTEELNIHGLSGLDSNPQTLLKELKVIAYYSVKNLGTEKLRYHGKWMPYSSMEKVVSQMDNESDSNKGLTGKQLISQALKLKGGSLTTDNLTEYLAKVFFKGKTGEAQKIFKANRAKLIALVNKTFTKTFDNEKLINTVNQEILELISKESGKSSSKDKMSGMEILAESLGKEKISSEDVKTYLAKTLFNGDKNEAKAAFDNNLKDIKAILQKTFSKTFDDEDLSDDLNESLKEAVVNTSQEAVQALIGWGFKKKEAEALVKGKTGTVEQIVLAALKEGGK